MSSVGIKELKAQLTRQVARAARGTEVVVKDRGRPVARVTALDPDFLAMEKMRLAGRATGGEGDPKDLLRIMIPLEPGQASPDLSGAVLENREEEARRFDDL